MPQQISLFGGTNEFKIDKPIRLIELFAGYGSQAFALKYLGVQFEHWRICEWAVRSIQAYKDAHFTDDNTDYSESLTQQDVVDYLFNKGISANYNEPMTYEQIKRLGENKQRQIYNNIHASHNLVNIQQAHSKDFDIRDTDKYCYVMTYSFPCQDLSSAGFGKGMEKGSGTRSGMLWEVERILDECNELPQVLLMENVPEVIGKKNIKHFAKWLEKLESLGYKCYWNVLNAKDYGVPQNRERCFMVSVLGDYFYEFPEPINLEHRLKDLLEDEVDEKFYLSNKAINGTLNTTFNCSQLGISPTVTTCGGGNREPKILEDNLKAKLCNDLIANGKVKENDVIRHNYTISKNGDCVQSNNESPTLDTRCDCLGVVVNSKNKRIKNCAGKLNPTIDGQFMDIFNQKNREDGLSGSLLAGMDAHQGNIVYSNLRIRKLTPKECFRLMGVKDKDFKKIAQNQSNASLYHLAGDSIVINVLMAIFEQII